MFFLRISCTSSSSRSHACITLAFPKLLHCTVHYTEIHVNYNRTIQRGITLLHHKAVFTNPCYYATLATMPLSLGPKGWHSIEVWLYLFFSLSKSATSAQSETIPLLDARITSATAWEALDLSTPIPDKGKSWSDQSTLRFKVKIC